MYNVQLLELKGTCHWAWDHINEWKLRIIILRLLRKYRVSSIELNSGIERYRTFCGIVPGLTSDGPTFFKVRHSLYVSFYEAV